jgi:hypothetical protein
MGAGASKKKKNATEAKTQDEQEHGPQNEDSIRKQLEDRETELNLKEELLSQR